MTILRTSALVRAIVRGGIVRVSAEIELIDDIGVWLIDDNGTYLFAEGI